MCRSIQFHFEHVPDMDMDQFAVRLLKTDGQRHTIGRLDVYMFKKSLLSHLLSTWLEGMHGFQQDARDKIRQVMHSHETYHMISYHHHISHHI